MKTKRIKATGLINRIDFEIAVDRVAYIQTELRQLEAQRDHAIQQIQQESAPLITDLQDELKAKAALCEKFAEEHRAELLDGKAKSAETPLSRYGFRTGMPQLKPLAKWTWDKIVEALTARGLDDKFVRVKLEADKAAMLCAISAKGILGTSTEPTLVGVRVVQDETFFIEPKVDGAEKVKGRSTSSGQGGAS